MKTFFLFLSLLGFIACSKTKSDDCPQTVYSYDYKTNANVDTIRSSANWLSVTETNGDSLLFRYTMNYIACPAIEDAGVTETLFFAVDPGVNSFIYSMANFQKAMVYFRRSCFCVQRGGFVVPQSGTITGTRLNAKSWKIDFDIMITNDDRVQHSAVFTEKQ